MTQALTYGVWCPAITPIDDDDVPRLDLLADHCRWVLDEGCHGVVLFGTTGEANSFTVAERQSVLEGIIARGISTDRLIVGTGCCALGDTVALTTHALSLGCARALVLPPFYYKRVSDEGTIDAYRNAIEAVADDRLRLYFYRIPQLSGVDIGRPVIETLMARYPTVIAGLKDSSGDWQSMQALCEEFSGSMDVLAGSERFLLAALAAGASGCVTATANADPRRLRELYEKRDLSLQERATATRDVFEALPVIAALKEFTARRTGDRRWRNVRPPLRTLDSAQAAGLLEFAGPKGLFDG